MRSRGGEVWLTFIGAGADEASHIYESCRGIEVSTKLRAAEQRPRKSSRAFMYGNIAKATQRRGVELGYLLRLSQVHALLRELCPMCSIEKQARGGVLLLYDSARAKYVQDVLSRLDVVDGSRIGRTA